MGNIINDETKEMVFKDFRQEETHIGYSQNINWISTKWSNPEEEGEYIVQLINGDYRTLHCTGNNNGEELILEYVRHYGYVTGYYYGSEEELTDSDWIEIGKSSRIWYYVIDWAECYGDYGEIPHYDYYFLKEEPKYYMSTPIYKLQIGSIENSEKEFYCFDKENNVVKES